MKLRPEPVIDDIGAQRDVATEDDADGTAASATGEKAAPGEAGPLKERAKIRWREAKSVSRRGVRLIMTKWRAVSLAVTVVAAVGLAGAVFLLQFRPNMQTDDSATRAAIKAASEGTVALLSYSPETLDSDLAAGKSHLTGELLRYFSSFSQHFVAPAVRQQGVKASASVLRAAVADMHPNSAVVLAFVHQTTSSKDKPDPILSTNNVRVTLVKVNGSWLIAKFEPE